MAELVGRFRISPETIPEKVTILSQTYAEALLKQLALVRKLPRDPVKTLIRAQFPEYEPQHNGEVDKAEYVVTLDFKQVHAALLAFSCERAQSWLAGIKAAMEDIAKEWSPEHKKEFLEKDMVKEIGEVLSQKLIASERVKYSPDPTTERWNRLT